MTSVTSLSGYSYSTSYKSSLDKNGDGVVTADEIAAASQTASSSSLSALSSTSSTEGTDDSSTVSSATDKFAALINELLMKMTAGESTPPSDGQGNDFLTRLDADGDGSLTAEEFAAGKPDDVSDEQSVNLFASLDTDGNGSLSRDELAAMQHGRGPEGEPPPPPPEETASSDTKDSTTDVTDLLQQLQQVITDYLDNLGDGSTEQSVLLTA